MEKEAFQPARRISTGDAAVSGMFAGLLGGVAMGAVVAAGSLAAGEGLAYLGKFSTGTPAAPGQGFVMHLGVSSIYGILYALLLHTVRGRLPKAAPGWLSGLLYAVGLWVFAVTLLLPATDALILELPWPVFFAGHVAYGLVLGARHAD